MSDNYEASNRLPFDIDGQRAIVGWMLKNREFAYKAKQHLNKDIFVTSLLGEIFSGIVDFTNQYQDVPSKENLITIFSYKNVEEFSKFKQEINDCIALSGVYNLSSLQSGITVWLQTSIFKNYSSKIGPHYKKANIPVMQVMMKDALSAISEVNFEKTLQYQFGDFLGDFATSKNEKTNCVTTGVSQFDQLIGGGLFPGEHTVVLGGLNTGKSTFALNVVYHNLMKEKDVLWMIHEGRPREWINKLRQRFLNCTKEELDSKLLSKDQETLNILTVVEDELQKHLLFLPILKSGGLYIEDIVDMVKMEQEKHYCKYGKYFDLIVDDYPKKLMSRSFSKSVEKRSCLEYVYEEFHRLGMEFSCHALTLAQVNREGYKDNRKREPGEYLGSENISEAFGIAQDCDNLFTLNRSDLDNKNNILYVHTDKTRGNANKQVIMFTTDYAKAITHDESMGCTVLTAGHKNTTLKSLVHD